MGSVKPGLIVAVTLILVVALIVVAITVMSPKTSTAPDFTITSIDGETITLSSYRNNRVVLLDFMSIPCSGCRIVANNLKEIAPSFGNDLQAISIDVWQTDTESALISYRDAEQIPWLVARDTDSLITKYKAEEIPKVVLVDKSGGINWVYNPTGGFDPTAQKEEMRRQISAAISGTGGSATVAQVSVYSLAILAAVGSFFSPCSFPLLPGYMAYYLGLDAGSKQKPSTRTAAGRGFLAALGMIVVYGIIAVIVFAIGYSAAAFVSSLGLYVGIILIALGALTLTPLQYHKLVEPFRKLRQRILPSKEGKEMGIGPKMFVYGVGYGAAGFACVAPPFIAAILNASIYGNIMFGVLVLVIYSAIVIALMIAITVLLSEAGQAAVKKMNRYVNVIKKISGIALIIAGIYLVWFWYVSQPS
jgi:cytochrome c-type biogenesis protein